MNKSVADTSVILEWIISRQSLIGVWLLLLLLLLMTMMAAMTTPLLSY
jgi:hypothetical protein